MIYGKSDKELNTPSNMDHRAWLRHDASQQLNFFRQSLTSDGRFASLNWDGTHQTGTAQELHTTTRMVHSYALGKAFRHLGSDDVIDAGMEALWNWHRDREHGGYAWSVDRTSIIDGQKLAYGHVFVLLAAASAKIADHPDADRLITDVSSVLDRHFWDEDQGRFREEFGADWTPLSSYRGMNANMHAAEALLTAFEATGNEQYLERAGRILDYFTAEIAPKHGWRIPEHYTEDWRVDLDYAGNPMFRPAGTTPGHSFELGRLLIQHWDLVDRPEADALYRARQLIDQALSDAWLAEGGFCYTLDLNGRAAVRDRYWWPVTEAIGALSVCLNVVPADTDETWYARLWDFAQTNFVDTERGGWFPELSESGKPVDGQFPGKPDIYHALQSDLIALTGASSRLFTEVENMRL